MIKQRYTETTTLSFNNLRDSRIVGTDGVVELSVYSGNEFIPAGSISNTASKVFTKGARIKFNLVSGTFFYIEMGEGA